MSPGRCAVCTLTAATLLIACRGSGGRTDVEPVSAVLSGTAGDTALFEGRIATVTRNPARVAFHLGRPAYVTLVSVDDRMIEAISPAPGARPVLVARGVHVASLLRGWDREIPTTDGRTNAPADLISAAAVMEYNRCLANARQRDAQRRSGPRPVVGRDSSGAPIYGPPTETADDARRSLQDRCRMPSVGIDPAAADYARIKPGRFLLLLASDTPIENVDISNLVVTSADIRATVQIIGDKLFTVRGARWSASYVAW